MTTIFRTTPKACPNASASAVRNLHMRQAAAMQDRRDMIAGEMERAVTAAVHVAALKVSQWYQDRKAELRSLDLVMARM